MGKKTPILISILTLLGSSTLCTSAFADEQGPWTFEEMNSFSQEVEALKDEQCKGSSDPYMCYRTYRWNGEDQEKYEAASSFSHNSFTITAINPSKSTIRVYFNSENIEAKHMGSDNYISDISDLFIAQFDSGYMNSVAYYVRNNIENPHMQLLFTGFESANGARWLPSNTEVEIPIDGLSLSPDKEQIMAVSYTDNSQANYGLYFNYSSCVNSPEYQDGMECQIRYANLDVPIFYVPVVPEEPATPAPETDIYKDEGYGNASGDSSGNLVEVVPTPKTPNTGVVSEECTKKVDFPWWLMVLILLGDVIAVWWFLPNHKRK